MLDWSPQQVSGWLKIQYPRACACPTRPFMAYFIQARGVLKKELIGYLRSKRLIRRSQHSAEWTCRSDHRGHLDPGTTSGIETRAIRTLGGDHQHKKQPHRHDPERHFHATTLIKIPSRETTVVVAALVGTFSKLPISLRRSLTWDQDTKWLPNTNLQRASTDEKSTSVIPTVRRRGTINFNDLVTRTCCRKWTCHAIRSRAEQMASPQ